MRVGMYAWGGPNTVRMIRTKWHKPRIDETSFMRLYDTEFLQEAKETLGLTDLWMTHAWGFSDATEREQYDFMKSRVPRAKQLGLKTYGYVQGFNVVSDEHRERDFFAQSAWGARIPYSRGRDLICPLHPETEPFLMSRVREAARAGFDAVYMDNIVCGSPPLYVARDFASSFGCHCEHCRARFFEQHAYRLPVRPESTQELLDVVHFRVNVVTQALSRIAARAREESVQFGVNVFDPFFYTPEIFFGFSFEALRPVLDYHVFETLGIAEDAAHVHHDHLPSTDKPTFIVSYRRGIGRDAMYDQNLIDTLIADAREKGHVACIKATEFVTDGVWHAFDFDRMRKARLHNGKKRPRHITPKELPASKAVERALVRTGDRFQIPAASLIANNALVQRVFESSGLLTLLLRKERAWVLPTITL